MVLDQLKFSHNDEFEKSQGVNFFDFNLADLPLSQQDQKKKLPKTETVSLPIVIEGKNYILNCTVRRKVNPEQENKEEEYKFQIIKSADNLSASGQEEWLLSGRVIVDMGFGHQDSATTTIKRNNEENVLPAGLGLVLYEKMLDFIQSKTNDRHKAVLHTVNHDPELGLTEEKWKKIFVPILLAKGYTEVLGAENQTWNKKYLPQT